METESLLKIAHKAIQYESQSILGLQKSINNDFINACRMITKCKGNIITIGMGKSGYIARKIAATLSSISIPAFFLHPGESVHGDMGAISEKDTIIIISKSGNSEELKTIFPSLANRKVRIIAITNNPNSALAKNADIILNTYVESESCSLNLIPSTSTTSALVLGDLISIVCMNINNFSDNDFAKNHPGGTIGKNLTTTVKDLMHDFNSCPKVLITTTLKQSLVEISNKKLGFTTVINNNNTVVGIFTDGDLRRALEQEVPLNTSIEQCMTKGFITINMEELAYEALKVLKKNKISTLIILDKQHKLSGAISIHNILDAGIGN